MRVRTYIQYEREGGAWWWYTERKRSRCVETRPDDHLLLLSVKTRTGDPAALAHPRAGTTLSDPDHAHTLSLPPCHGYYIRFSVYLRVFLSLETERVIGGPKGHYDVAPRYVRWGQRLAATLGLGGRRPHHPHGTAPPCRAGDYYHLQLYFPLCVCLPGGPMPGPCYIFYPLAITALAFSSVTAI